MEQRINPNSKWKDYISELNEDFENYPLLYPYEEKLMLYESGISKRLVNLKRIIEQDYNVISSHIPPFRDLFSFDNFLKTYAQVHSRLLPSSDTGKFTAMVPFADFFNGVDGISNSEWRWENKGYSLYST